MKITIDDDLEKEFRQVAYREKGPKRGFLKAAAEEAIRMWLVYIKLKKDRLSKTYI